MEQNREKNFVTDGIAQNVLSEQDSQSPQDSQNSQDAEASSPAASIDRALLQRKRAIGAVLVVVLFSVALLACFELISYLSKDGTSIFSSHKFAENVAENVEEEVQIVTQETPTEPFYVLLIGSDSRKGTALYTGKADGHAQLDQHADVITLMRIDPENYLITLVSIPRDTQLEGTASKISDTLLDNDPE